MRLAALGVVCVIVGSGFVVAQSFVGYGVKGNDLTGTDVIPPLFLGIGVIWLVAALILLVNAVGKWIIHSPPRLLGVAANPYGGGVRNPIPYALHLLHDAVPVDCRDAIGETPLMKAAQRGDIEMVKLFLLYGADPRLQNKFGQTALLIAASKNYRAVVALLQQAGSDRAS